MGMLEGVVWATRQRWTRASEACKNWASDNTLRERLGFCFNSWVFFMVMSLELHGPAGRFAGSELCRPS